MRESVTSEVTPNASAAEGRILAVALRGGAGRPISARGGRTPLQASKIATGKGVIVAISNANNVAGNPNFIRPDGQHVVAGSPTPNADAGDDEVYGDVSSVAAQGDVVYDMPAQLPFSHLPAGCTFTIEGDAPGATIVDENTLGPQGQIPPGALRAPESEVIAGIDNAVVNEHADVVSESFGFGGRELRCQPRATRAQYGRGHTDWPWLAALSRR